MRRWTVAKRIGGGILALGFAGLIVLWIQPLPAFAVIERVTPNIVWRVQTEQPLVGLSFDDGPDSTYTPQVLEILQRYGARATFFLIGERAERHPELVSRIRAEGHEVGNHYFVPRKTLTDSDAEFADYLERAELAAQIHGYPKLFRPPGGLAWPSQLRLAHERGYTCVLGNAYPHDPARPPVWYMAWLVRKNLAPGSIVILHDGITNPSKSLEVLPLILDAGRRKNLRFVAVGSLLAAAGMRTNKASRLDPHLASLRSGGPFTRDELNAR